MFKLTEEQINEIVLMYGRPKEEIKEIELKINLIGVVEDEKDFFEIMSAVISQKVSIELQIKQWNDPENMDFIYMSDEEIIETELNRKYNSFEDSSPIIKQKMLNFVNQKNRHN